MKKIFFVIAVSFTWTIASSQNVGVGTTTPVEKLDVVGNIKTTGEIKPNGTTGQAGDVLTSNGNGTMQWAQAKAASGGGNGGWGDCSIYNIDSFRVAANSDAQPGDFFGHAVSISGDYAIVGSPYDSEGGFINNGSATILKFNSATGQWNNVQKLTNAAGATGDLFGYAVAIYGDYAIVGAYRDADGAFTLSGSVTIFKRNTTSGLWESQGKLVNPTPANSDFFGFTVAISADYAMVGALNDDEAGFTDNGSVTIFKRNITSGIWENQGKILSSMPGNYDSFGTAVSISGDYAIVGAPYDNNDADGKVDVGSVEFFKRNASGVWISQGKFFKPNATVSDLMGTSVSISGDHAVASMLGHDEGMLDGNGAVSIYKRNTVSGVWESQGLILDPYPASEDYFGKTVSITADYMIVGSPTDDENGGMDNGSVTVFKRIESIWYPYQKFTNPGNPATNQFGTAVGVHGNRFIVGASFLYSTKGMVFFGSIK